MIEPLLMPAPDSSSTDPPVLVDEIPAETTILPPGVSCEAPVLILNAPLETSWLSPVFNAMDPVPMSLLPD